MLKTLKKKSGAYLKMIGVAVREEAHIVHVRHDLLEHLQALVQQGKPAQATMH